MQRMPKKNGTVLDTVLGVIDTSTFPAKKFLDECIHHIQTAHWVDMDCVLEMLRMSLDWVHLVSLSNALTEMARFCLVDVSY